LGGEFTYNGMKPPCKEWTCYFLTPCVWRMGMTHTCPRDRSEKNVLVEHKSQSNEVKGKSVGCGRKESYKWGWEKEVKKREKVN